MQCFSWLSTNTANYSVVWGTGQRGTLLLICKGIKTAAPAIFGRAPPTLSLCESAFYDQAGHFPLTPGWISLLASNGLLF